LITFTGSSYAPLNSWLAGDAGRVAAKWVTENGYHRVLIYSDFREEVKESATLMNIKVIEEDQ